MQVKPKVDWTKVPAGTMIRVRDFDSEDWNVREFVRYDAHIPQPYTCKTVSFAGTTTSDETRWELAELIENQTDNFKDDSIPAVEDIMNLVEEYSSSHGYYTRVDIRNKIVDMLIQMRNTNATKDKPKVQIKGDSVSIPYEITQKFLKITTAQYDLIKKLYPENKVSIIKWLRAEYKQGLKETKDICDTICGLN